MQVYDAFRYPSSFTLISLAFWQILLVSCYLQDTRVYERSHVSSHVLRPASYYHAIGNTHAIMSYRCQSNTEPHKCYGVQQIRNAYSITP
jgi:hypothetical protein